MAVTPEELDRLHSASPRLRLVDAAGGEPALSVVTLLAPPAPGREAPDVVVAIAGEVDVATAARVRAELRLAQALRPGRLILDLAGVTFLDAAGISAILSPCRAGDLRVTMIAPPGTGAPAARDRGRRPGRRGARRPARGRDAAPGRGDAAGRLGAPAISCPRGGADRVAPESPIARSCAVRPGQPAA